MPVTSLDHVNIICHDLDETVRFYCAVLGLRATPTPNAPPGWIGFWLYDAEDRAILHLMPFQAERHGTPPRHEMITGSIDHIAFACTGFAAMIAHCAALGVAVKVNDGKFGKLRQIFITDPNNVVLELNYRGD